MAQFSSSTSEAAKPQEVKKWQPFLEWDSAYAGEYRFPITLWADPRYLLVPDACQHGLMLIAAMPQCTEATIAGASETDSLKSIFLKTTSQNFRNYIQWFQLMKVPVSCCSDWIQ